MRRRYNKDNKSKKNLVLSLFIVVIMTLSVGGYIMGSGFDSTTVRFNGIKFVGGNNNWVAKINGQKINFEYLPENLLSINVTDSIIDKLKASPQIDFTSNLTDEYAESIALFHFEFLDTLSKTTKQYLRKGYTTDNEFDLPVITCSDATSFVPVIYIEKSNQLKISEINNCIILSYKNQDDIVAIKNRILFGMFDII
jgi:hypothetical protein